MIRSVALSVLIALSFTLVAPALAPSPAYAARGTPAEVSGGLPWNKVALWVLKNALTLFMLAEEVWRDLQGGDHNPPPEQPPKPQLVDESPALALVPVGTRGGRT